MKYIRDYYGVPVKRGARIRFTYSDGSVVFSRITSARYGRIKVIADVEAYAYKNSRRRLILHPT